MSPEKLDFIFPFIVLAYGFTVSLVLHTPFLMDLAEKRIPPEFHRQLNAHRGLALLCLVVGSLWGIQNLWSYN